MGVAKKSNSSRRRFSRCRRKEKCKPALPPDVKMTKVGGRTAICVMYWTCKREPPWVFAGVMPARCLTSRSKNSFRREVAMRVRRALPARTASGNSFWTRWPFKAEIVTTDAQLRNFIWSRNARSNAAAVPVSLFSSASHLLTARIIEQPASTP